MDDDSVLSSPATTLRSLGLAEVGLAVVIALLDFFGGGPTLWSYVAGLLFVTGHILVGSSYVVAARGEESG